MPTPWGPSFVGGVWQRNLPTWVWDASLDVGCDPLPAAWVSVPRGAPSYDQENGYACAAPTGAGLAMSFMETEFRLPAFDVVHVNGAPLGFGFSFDWFADVSSVGVVKLCLFWQYKVVGDGVDGASVAWNTVSAYNATALVANVRCLSVAVPMSPAGWVGGGLIRLRLGRRRQDGANIDNYANSAVVTGATAYVVTN